MARYLDIVLKHYYFNKCLCYNSFAEPHWYWGPKRNSEKFELNSNISKRLLLEWPEAVLTYIPCSDKENVSVVEMGLS